MKRPKPQRSPTAKALRLKGYRVIPAKRRKIREAVERKEAIENGPV